MKKLILISIYTSVFAMQFQTLGYQSIGMGGASVANSENAYSTYNNPALLAKENKSISFSAGIEAHDYNLATSIKAIKDTHLNATINKLNGLTLSTLASITPDDVTNLENGRTLLLNVNGNSVVLNPQAALAIQYKNFGFGVFSSSDIALTAYVDKVHDQLIFNNGSLYYKVNSDGTVSNSNSTAYTNTSMEYALQNGLTYLEAKGFVLAEVPIAYGTSYDIGIGNLMVGGAVKYIEAETYIQKFKVDNYGSSDTSKHNKLNQNFGVDIGLAYVPSFSKNLTIGIVGKDLNTPSFKFEDGSNVKVDPMVRAGVAYNIFDSLQIAGDIDLTNNKTMINGLNSQNVGGGLDFHPLTWFSIRGGLFQNLDHNDKAGIIYTSGITFGPKVFNFDISGQMSGNKTSINNVSYPEYAKVNFSLNSSF